ncbi:hypothetical protein [Frankia sp. Cr2]|uniref:hypothetical protein n=1 Tax=Frankia sp. Cr2 TaxID=3073932 RepID=UPI002AD51E1C|nr:hypothetical protein [Frankia sp. Cr2]
MLGSTDGTIVDTAQDAGDGALGAGIGVGAGWHAPTVGDAEDEPGPVGDAVGAAAFGAGGSTFTCWVAYCGADFTCWTFWIRTPCTLLRRFNVTTFRLVVMAESPSVRKRSLSATWMPNTLSMATPRIGCRTTSRVPPGGA